MAKFSVSYNGKIIKTYELEDAVITIGRLPENKICISNMGISGVMQSWKETETIIFRLRFQLFKWHIVTIKRS